MVQKVNLFTLSVQAEALSLQMSLLFVDPKHLQDQWYSAPNWFVFSITYLTVKDPGQYLPIRKILGFEYDPRVIRNEHKVLKWKFGVCGGHLITWIVPHPTLKFIK